MFKKTVLISSLILALSACTEQQNTNTTNQTNNSESKVSENQSSSMEKETQVKEVQNKNENMEKMSTEFVAGTHYRVLENPIELKGVTGDHVIEYFWLACPHCQSFEPIIQKVDEELENVEVIKRHAALGQRWAKDAVLYYNMKELGHEEHLYDLFMFYKEIGENEKRLPELEDINEFLASKNIDSEEFFKNTASKSISKEIEKTINEMNSNDIMGVPAVVVNGKYLINNGQLPSGTDYSELVEFLTNLK